MTRNCRVEITGTYSRFLEAVEKAGRRGNVGEDLTQGYSRIADLSARAIQDMFPVLANEHLAELRAVLHNSDDEQQRGYRRVRDSVCGGSQGGGGRTAVCFEGLGSGRARERGARAQAMAVKATLDPSRGSRLSRRGLSRC